MGGIRDSVAGRRVTSAFMSLSNSSSWFRTGARATEKEGREKDGKGEMEPGKEMRNQIEIVRRGERTGVKEPETKKMTEKDRKKSNSGKG